MKLYVYYSLFIILGYQKVINAEDISTYDIKDDINALIESVRDVIPEVITVPSLDVEVPDSDYLSGYLNISNVEIQGIKEFNATITYFLVIPTAFSIKLDLISIDLEYLADMALFHLPLLSIFGEGTGSVSITNLLIDGKLAVTLAPNVNVSINSVHIGLDDAKFAISGLLNDEVFSNIINNILNDNVATIINENEHAISTVVEDAVNAIISEILANSTATDIYDNQILMDSDYSVEVAVTQIFKTLTDGVKSMINYNDELEEEL